MAENEQGKIWKRIGSNIRYKRKKLDLTIEEFSDFVDISSGFVGLIERGERGTSILNLIKIAEFLEITLDDLILKGIDFSINKIDDKKQKKLNLILLRLKALRLEELDFIYDVIIKFNKINNSRNKNIL